MQTCREELDRALWEIRYVPDGFTRRGYPYGRALSQFLIVWLGIGHRPRLTRDESDIQQVCRVCEGIYGEIRLFSSPERPYSPFRIVGR